MKPNEALDQLLQYRGCQKPATASKINQALNILDRACRAEGLNTIDFIYQTIAPKPTTTAPQGIPCPRCGKEFASTNALNGHRKGCK